MKVVGVMCSRDRGYPRQVLGCVHHSLPAILFLGGNVGEEGERGWGWREGG